MKKKMKLIDLILPSRSINFFVGTVMVFGIISGSIFLMVLSKSDKNLVIEQIQHFFQIVSESSFDDGLAFKNSLIINYLFVFGIWILGLSMIGVIINIFITYLKGFLVGFSISSIFLTFGYKGILAALIYSFPSQILSVIVICILSIYSIMFSFQLMKIIFSKKGNQRLMLKKYSVILMMAIVIIFISSLIEVYVFPRVLRMVIGFYTS